jgi:hypothetical protein
MIRGNMEIKRWNLNFPGSIQCGPRPDNRATYQRRKAQRLSISKAKPNKKKHNAAFREVVLIAHLTEHTIGRFDTKSTSITAIDCFGLPIDARSYEKEPLTTTFSILIWNQCGDDGHRRLGSIGKRV